MNSVTTPNLSQPAILSGTEVEERPKVHPGDHADQPLPPVTEDPRYIGTSSERPSARKLVQGQGTYIDDIELPRMVHVVYWRSPLAHAKITRIDMDAARKAPGVVLVAAAEETRWQVVQDTTRRMQMMGINLLGTVLNKQRYHIPQAIYDRI